MSDANLSMPERLSAKHANSIIEMSEGTRKRNAAEKRFRTYGMIAISVGLLFLAVLIVAIVRNGIPAFTQTYVTVAIDLPEESLDPNGNRNIDDLKKVSTFGYNPLIDAALERKIAELGLQDIELSDGGKLRDMLSSGAGAQLRNRVIANPDVIGTTQEFRLLAGSRVD